MSRQISGLQAWILQRVTAIYLALGIPLFLLHLLLWPPADVVAWRNWVGTPLVSGMLLLGLFALLLHAWVGTRNLLLDYVRPLGWRLAGLAVLASGLVICGIWALRVLLLAMMHG